MWNHLKDENPEYSQKLAEIRRVFKEVEETKRVNPAHLEGLLEHCFKDVQDDTARSLLVTFLMQRMLSRAEGKEPFHTLEEAKALLKEFGLEESGARSVGAVRAGCPVGKGLQ